jgi:hypothetical protein
VWPNVSEKETDPTKKKSPKVAPNIAYNVNYYVGRTGFLVPKPNRYSKWPLNISTFSSPRPWKIYQNGNFGLN